MDKETLQKAYASCQQRARTHYENFPVASRLLPKKLRLPIAVIYTFAREADDIADEGNASPDERLAALEAFSEQLDAIGRGEAMQSPIFIALADVIEKHHLPLSLFHDLLTAFKSDIRRQRYQNFGEVIQYCRHSANPVGRLLLHLDNSATEENLACSDMICTSLQLINFLQDIHQDLVENNRIYLPQDELQQFGVSEEDIRNRVTSPNTQNLLRFQIQRAHKLMQSGAPLGKILKGRLGLEIRMIIMGGSRVLYKLNQQADNIFSRPRLNKYDLVWILWKAIRAK